MKSTSKVKWIKKVTKQIEITIVRSSILIISFISRGARERARKSTSQSQIWPGKNWEKSNTKSS